MTEYDYDLLTIGAGSGGVAASRRAAALGARTAICEDSRVGGTCVIRGCVPKKLLIYGVGVADTLADAAGYGWTIPEARFDWSRLIAAKDKEIDRLNGIYLGMLERAGVALFPERGRLIDAHTVRVGERRLTAERILVATGSRPFLPDLPGIEHAITSNEALSLPAAPRSIVILGGGYIAVEFASIFRAVGVEVTILIRGDKILRGFDEDVRDALTTEMTRRGIRIVAGVRPLAIEPGPDGPAVRDAGGAVHAGERVLAALGRVPNTDDLGLEAAGVERGARGEITVDADQRSSIPSVFAVGDVTDRVALTPVAIAEGRAFAETQFGGTPTRPNRDNIPTAVFSIPPVGTVGLTEAEARADRERVDIFKTEFRPMRHTLSGRAERILMKLVVDPATDRVLGCHMVGPDAPEMMEGLAIALNAGATKAVFDRTIALHPSTSEEWVLMRERSA